LIDLVAAQRCPTNAVVRDHLSALQQADYPQLSEQLPGERKLLLLNARIVPSVQLVDRIFAWAAEAGEGIVRSGEAVAAALIAAEKSLPAKSLRHAQLADFFSYAGLAALAEAPLEIPLLQWPHDVVRCHQEIFADNLSHRLQAGDYHEISDGVFAAGEARLGQYVVTDSSAGPIVLEAGASVGPYTYLSGPAHIGAKARVLEHAAIKDGVALGHTTKIGGEVEASIIEPFTNKQHHGFLGHSYLGSWINLGAGTCNSDLKNTYGNVKMDYRGQRISSGMQFVGCFLGDYAKTAINTSIFTGKTIGACSMVYGFVTTNVPSFVNYARSFGQVTELPPEVMASTQQRMFARRNVEQRPCDIELLHAMYRLTQDERQLAGEPLQL
jgi:glucose-1-phosphate thymidylyltransferase